MRASVTIAATLLMLTAAGAGAAWVVDEHGTCVRQWEASDLGRGPTAMLEGLTMPVRSAVGGFQVARHDKTGGLQRDLLLPPLLTVAGGGGGLAEGLIWIGTGLGDTVTGGAFGIAPEEATQLSVAPVTPAFIADGRRPTTDACGRPLR